MGTTDVQDAAEAEGPEITEIVAFDVAKVAGAKTPANGTTFLMVKALDPAVKAKGAAGLEPPTQTGFQGTYGGVTPPGPGAGSGVGCGCCPACKCPPPGAAKSADGLVIAIPLGVPDGIVALAKEASRAVVDAYASIDGPWSYTEGALIKRTFTADQRRDLAARGQALADGTYPIETAEDLGNAASLARSKHGNWKAASRLIGKMAAKLGVRNPMKKNPKGGAAKGAVVAPGGAAVDTGASDGLAKTVQDAVTKATEPLAKEIADLKSARDHLQGELAKVQALPMPGGPVLSATRPGTSGDAVKKTRLLAKAEEYEELARNLANPPDREAYAKLAAQAREDAATLGG